MKGDSVAIGQQFLTTNTGILANFIPHYLGFTDRETEAWVPRFAQPLEIQLHIRILGL